MISNITQVGFKTIIALSSIAILTTGCVNNLQPKAPKKGMTQIEWRTLQTKLFDTKDNILVSKALIAALQDEGYEIKNANVELGLITASIEKTKIDEDDRMTKIIWAGKAENYQVAERTEVSCSLSTVKNKTKVRLSITQKGINESGVAKWSQQASNPKLYQNIFSKVDKSIILEKENI